MTLDDEKWWTALEKDVSSLVVMAHAEDPTTWEAEAAIFLSSRPIWAINPILGHL